MEDLKEELSQEVEEMKNEIARISHRKVKLGNFAFKIKTIVAVVTLFAVLLAGIYLGISAYKMFAQEKEITSYISGKLEDMSELTLQKVTFSGRYSIKEGKIPLIDKRAFTMSYNAEMKAGIDFSEVKFEVEKKAVKIKIPHSKSQGVKIDPSSIQFFDEKSALFNWNKKEDISNAIAAAEIDIEEKTDFSQLLEEADKKAVELMHDLFDNNVGKREVLIEFK